MGFSATDIPWVDPAELAASVAGQDGDMAFLHSSLKTGYSGQFSLLAWDAEHTYTGYDFDVVPPAPSIPLFGYFGYELGRTLETIPETKPSFIDLPFLHLAQFRQVLRFDHHRQIIESWQGKTPQLPTVLARQYEASAPGIAKLESNMSKHSYHQAVQDALNCIADGHFYQVNLTRKFFGRFERPVPTFDLYRRLIGASPAPYSAFLRLEGTSILSSSPELFLKINDGMITSRPIKGTAPRGKTQSEDADQKTALAESRKDHAENLMIVDLVRHDLSRVSIPGSVNVSELCTVDSFPTVHHLSSVIQGSIADGKTSIDAFKAAFPPGSMTGAPKIAAMRWLAEREAVNRGAYSGALGWFLENEAELSVVIRTLIVQEDRFEFQVGGGIVADSTPEAEWMETIYKAEGILRSLGINTEAIKVI
ncbi:MAG: chorismate-binding protein [Rickettsiales bacterium]